MSVTFIGGEQLNKSQLNNSMSKQMFSFNKEERFKNMKNSK